MLKILEIKKVIIPSDGINFITIYNFINKRVKGIEYYYDVRGLTYLSDLAKTNRLDFCKIKYKYEMTSFKKCNGAIFLTPELERFVKEEFGFRKKSVVVENCISIKENYIPVLEYNLEKNVKKDINIFTIGFFGNVTGYEWMDGLINSIIELNSDNFNIKLKIIGNIKCKIDLNCEFIEVKNWIPQEKLIDEFKKINLFIVPRFPYKVCELVSPIKIFLPMLLGVPVLLSDCECLNTISDNGGLVKFLKRGKKKVYKKK